MNETFDMVKALIVQECKVAPEAITPATPLGELGLDSLAALEFVFTLEDMFHVTLNSETDLRGGKVQDVVDIVSAALAGRPASLAAD
jgi:acyl carrier protein